MSTSSKARIDSIVTEPFDPVYEPWVDDEDEHTSGNAAAQNPHLHEPGFDPSYPFSPFQNSPEIGISAAPGWDAAPEGRFFESPEHSPQLRPTATAIASSFEYPNDMVSPLSPPATFPSSTLRHANQEMQPLKQESRDLREASVAPYDRPYRTESQSKRESAYTIPEAPPPPLPMDVNLTEYERERGETLGRDSLPMDVDLTDYERERAEALGGDSEGQQNRQSPGVRRHGSIAQRLGSRLMGTVRRNRTSGGRWSAAGRRSRVGDLGATDGAPDYMELDEREEAIGVDISTFGPEFAAPLPQAAVRAMEQHGFDDELAYTGTGEAIDLSNLTGFNDENQDSDTFSLNRAGTIENTNKQSFFFSPGRHVPNWKPVVLQTWYLVTMIILTIAMMVAVGYLYYLSDKHIIRKEPGKKGGGLFAYTDINKLSVLEFAIWKYFPTLVGVIYGILWKVTDEELKRSEPYYQLSKGSTGALAAESLNIEYHTVWSPMVPYSAIKYRQLVVAAGGIVSFLASSAVPVFLSVFIRVDPSQKQRKKEDIGGKTVVKRLVVDKVWTWLLEVTLGIIVICAIYIVWKLTRRRSGLLGDPSGIAGVAAMANKSHILVDFRDLDLATEAEIHKQLNKRTYVLHKGALWQSQTLRESERDYRSAPKAMNPHPLLLRVKGMGPFLVFCFFMIIFLPIVVFHQKANVVIDKTPWIITGISILIKSVWELLEKELRVLEPFWILFNRNAHSSVLTLDYSSTIPGFIILKALSKGHLLLAWVTFVTILIEVLTVVLGSLDSQGGEESRLSSRMSFFLAIFIFLIVLGTGWLVLQKRRHPFLPRQPGTISSVLAFIHQSRMLMDFEGTEQKTTLARKRKLAKVGRRYGFGWYLGRDGKRHLGIDFEPLLEGYTIGRDPRKAVMDAPVGWDQYDQA